MRMVPAVVAIVTLAAVVVPAMAGPPYATDGPVPTNHGHLPLRAGY